MNPYQGCEHACVYCDARSDRYYLHKDFEETIYYKKNAPELLENKLKHMPSIDRDVIAFGGMCDAYQPIEKDLHLSEKLLQIMLKYRYPVTLSTKSVLIRRDLALLNEIGKNSGSCITAFTITTTNQEIWRFLEPRTAPPEERFQIIREIKEHFPHIQIGVNFMPIVPLLEDSQDNIEAVIKGAAIAGVDYILAAPGVTLRDRQGDFFLTALNRYDPVIGQRFQEFYLPQNPDGRKKQNLADYHHRINVLIKNICLQYHIPMRARRWIPPDFRRINYLIAEELLNQAYQAQNQNANSSELFWAGQKIQNLNTSYIDPAGHQKSIPNVILPIRVKQIIDQILSNLLKNSNNIISLAKSDNLNLDSFLHKQLKDKSN
jgi:DNA repair photolyase